MPNKINLKDRSTIDLLQNAIGTKRADIQAQRKAKNDISTLEWTRYEQELAEYSLLYAKLQLEWRLVFNKQFTDPEDAIELKKDKLEADICRLNVDKAQQNLDLANSDYGLALSEQ